MDTNEITNKRAELERLRKQIALLEGELAVSGTANDWTPSGYYTTYHVLAGMILGLIAASVSLIANVIGSAMFGKHPLELIRVYLTFPMGETALEMTSGFALAAGCCLYLGTGMIGGIPFHMILSRFFDKSDLALRFAVATILGLGVWIVNFYGVLSWLQPMLIGGNWIVDQVPWYVAAFTHLIFGWAMLAVDQWGRFVPPSYSRERSAT